MGRRSIFPFLPLAVLLSVCPLCLPADELIPAGTDYLHTVAGTYATLPGIGLVDLVGNPSACGAACLYGSDTVVNRAAEVPSGTPDTPGQLEGSIQITLSQLWLRSASPVNIGGSFFDVFVNLDPNVPSTGQLDLMNTNGEGTTSTPEGVFAPSSFFDVFFDVSISLAGSGNPPVVIAADQTVRLTSSGSWNDPDDGTSAVLAGQVSECNPGVNCHVADPVPESSSLLLLITTVACCAVVFRRNRAKV